MRSVRSKAVVLATIAAMLVGVSGRLVAAERHAMCAAQKHGCGATAQFVKCCCPDGSHRGADSTPAPAKVEIPRSIATATPAIAIDADLVITMTRDAVQSSPPVFAVLDRQALFSSFLI